MSFQQLIIQFMTHIQRQQLTLTRCLVLVPQNTKTFGDSEESFCQQTFGFSVFTIKKLQMVVLISFCTVKGKKTDVAQMVETCKQKQIKNRFKSRSMWAVQQSRDGHYCIATVCFSQCLCLIHLQRDLQLMILCWRKAPSPACLNRVGLPLSCLACVIFH